MCEIYIVDLRSIWTELILLEEVGSKSNVIQYQQMPNYMRWVVSNKNISWENHVVQPTQINTNDVKLVGIISTGQHMQYKNHPTFSGEKNLAKWGLTLV